MTDLTNPSHLRALRLWHVEGDYAFVHAGIRPEVPLDEQQEADVLWIRGPFLTSDRDHGKVVVHGHTIVPEPEVFANRIGIDTGAWYSGRLTAWRSTATGSDGWPRQPERQSASFLPFQPLQRSELRDGT